MLWVSSSKNIPIPLVHYYDASHVTPYMVTDKCEGSLLIDAFGILPFEAKVVFPHYPPIFLTELIHRVDIQHPFPCAYCT